MKDTMLRLRAALVLCSSLFLPACNRADAATPETRSARTKSTKAAAKADTAKTKASPASREHAEGPQKFVVPFAWEASRDEPLSQARGYLKEILGDNRIYMEHGPKFFASFAEGQKPRATVLSCADSRVHTTAFDTTPENDDFMVRNIGNQLENSGGSVEYGVEHLETPVLIVLGHTGCGAVKAAMGDVSSLSEPVRRELEKLRVTKPKSGASSEAAWADAVVENVRAQVSTALGHFGSRVQQGKLTVVGAVYDFRNDLGNGAGKISIVDVNGNSETERMRAFVAAVEAEGSAAPSAAGAKRKGSEKARLDVENPEVSRALKEAIGKVSALTVEQRGEASKSKSR